MTPEQQKVLTNYYKNTEQYQKLTKKRWDRWHKAVSSKEEFEKFANELLEKKHSWL